MARWISYILLFSVFAGLSACSRKQGDAETILAQPLVSTETEISLPTLPPPDSPTEERMREMGLVDITEIDSSIRVHLVYATADNFLGYILYEDIRKAFLLPVAAEKLSDARRRLQAERPELTFLVYDAARPFSVQEQMWKEAVKQGKLDYVANPKKGGGLHNYGAAVDLTLCDLAGNPLPMGSPYDYLGVESNIDRENDLLRKGEITQRELDNRRLLRRAMTGAGFRTVTSEWWHFNLISRAQAVATLQKVE